MLRFYSIYYRSACGGLLLVWCGEKFFMSRAVELRLSFSCVAHFGNWHFAEQDPTLDASFTSTIQFLPFGFSDYFRHLMDTQPLPRTKILTPFIVVFILLNSSFLFAKGVWVKLGVDTIAAMGGNILLLLVTFFSIWSILKTLHSKNPHAFVRGVNTSVLVKLMLCALAAFVYIFVKGSNNVTMGTVFAFLVMYIVYTAIEVRQLLKLNNKKAS
jgi:hypothetical protein